MLKVSLSKILLVLIASVPFIISCGGEKMAANSPDVNMLKEISDSAWDELSKQKIYFGHQSVGNNIIMGLQDVIKDNPQVKLSIVETSNPDLFKTPLFAHSRVGKNEDPLSKNRAFAEVVENGIGGKADFAFFKYCYIDIPRDADVEKLFNDYKQTMMILKTRYPDTTFIHVTVPLTIVQTGPKVLIKRIIGRPIGGYDENIKRNEFNMLLRKEYESKEPIFDLAEAESVHPDGRKQTFENGGKTYAALIPGYSYDGRHLNESGRRIVAEKLLIFLADLAQQKTGQKTAGQPEATASVK